MSDETFSHEQILDNARLGNEPSADYLQRIETLDNVVRECMHVTHSYAGIPAPTSQHFYASVLFTTLVTRGVSLANLAPFSPWAEKRIEHWDYASAAVIVRTMLEIRLCFYYICADPCSRVEWECRWNILNLHDCTARIKLFAARGRDEDQVKGFEVQAEDLRRRLRDNDHFSSLPAGRQKRYLNGQTAYMSSLEEIAVKAGIELGEFRWLYVLLSTHVHGLPMSFYRMGLDSDERGRGLPSPAEENYTMLCLSLAAKLLVGTRDEVHILFKELVRPFPPSISVKSEAKIEGLSQSDDAMSIGEVSEISDNGTIRIEVKRLSVDKFSITYHDVQTGEVVLDRSISEKEGSLLHWFDAMFWTVIVNGKPATQKMAEKILSSPVAFKIDADTRTINLKLEL